MARPHKVTSEVYENAKQFSQKFPTFNAVQLGNQFNFSASTAQRILHANSYEQYMSLLRSKPKRVSDTSLIEALEQIVIQMKRSADASEYVADYLRRELAMSEKPRFALPKWQR